MTPLSHWEFSRKGLQALQIIVAMLTIAPFPTVIVALAGETIEPTARGMLTLGSLAALVTAMAIVVRLFLFRRMVQAGRRRIARGQWPAAARRYSDSKLDPELADSVKLFSVYSSSTIVSCALLEGAAFLASTAYLIERDPLSLLLAVTLSLGVALHFPTRNRVDQWIEAQRAELTRDRAEQLPRY